MAEAPIPIPNKIRAMMNIPIFWAAACMMVVQTVNSAATASAFFRPSKSVIFP